MLEKLQWKYVWTEMKVQWTNGFSMKRFAIFKHYFLDWKSHIESCTIGIPVFTRQTIKLQLMKS